LKRGGPELACAELAEMSEGAEAERPENQNITGRSALNAIPNNSLNGNSNWAKAR
jgi:hypothetical protein